MHLIRHHFRKWVLNYIKTLIFLTNEGSCLLFFHIEIVRDFFYAPPISSSIPCCNKKSWVQKITKSWVRIEIPIDGEETKQKISSFQRNENEDPENEDSIFESTVEIDAKLKLKSSAGKEEMLSVIIPAQVVVNSMMIIKNRQTKAECLSTAANVLEKLKHENMKLQQENLALKNQLNINDWVEAPLRPWSFC